MDTTGARRRRPLLLSVTSLGVTLALVGLAGVFAIGSDRATTGENSAETGVLGGEHEVEVDLELATAAMPDVDDSWGFAVECGEFADDLTTGLLQTTPEELLDSPAATAFCLRNVGSQAALVTWSAFDLVDVEAAPCAPGEQAAGDLDCDQPDGNGELAGELSLRYDVGCNGHDERDVLLGDLAAEPWDVVALAPGQVVAACIVPEWRGGAISQTDRVTYRLAFDGEALPPGTCADDLDDDTDRPWPYLGPTGGHLCVGDWDTLLYHHPGGDLRVTLVIGDGSAAFGSDGTNLDLVVVSFPPGKEPDNHWAETEAPVEQIHLEDAPADWYFVGIGAAEPAEAPYTLTIESLP